MSKEIEVFQAEVLALLKPKTIDLQAIADASKGLTINGIDDKEGYDKVYQALRSLQKARTTLTDFAKSLRDEYTIKNREIRTVEDKYLAIIVPIENELKEKRLAIDEERKRQERLALLPSRKDILATIEVIMTDGEILAMDEKEFSEFFQTKKIAHLERKEQERMEAEREKERLAELERMKEKAAEEARLAAEAKAEEAKKEAARKAQEDLNRAEKEKAEAIARAEREKQEAIDKLKREQEESEKKRVEAEEKKLAEAKRMEDAKIAEAERIERERVETQAKAEKNKKYQDWIESIKYNPADGDKIERVGDTFIAYKKVGEITIK